MAAGDLIRVLDPQKGMSNGTDTDHRNRDKPNRRNVQGLEQSGAPSKLSRRGILVATGSTLTTALAGCSGSGGDGSSTDRLTETGAGESGSGTETNTGGTGTGTETKSSSGLIESATFLPKKRAVELTFSSPKDVAEVTIERPDGDTVEEVLTEEKRTVTIPVELYDGESIPGGVYEVTAEFNGKTVGSATVSVTKQLRITDVAVEQVKRGDEKYNVLVVSVKNTGELGFGPDSITVSGQLGENTKISGSHSYKKGIAPGQTKQFELVSYARTFGNSDYYFTGDGACTGSGEVTFKVETSGEGVVAAATATMTVSGKASGRDSSSKGHRCGQITIKDVSTTASGSDE